MPDTFEAYLCPATAFGGHAPAWTEVDYEPRSDLDRRESR